MHVLYVLFITMVVIAVLWSRDQIEYFTPSMFIKSTVTIPVDYVKMKRCTSKGVSKIEGNILGKFKKVKDESWNLYVPCGYTYVEKELSDNDHFRHRENGWILGIQGADLFAAKDRAWNLLMKKYGRLRATIFMPESWVTYDNKQMKDFYTVAKQSKNKGQIYIMKKNIQQQQGLHIFTDPSEAVDAFSNDFVVVQRVLGNPFIINGRKINIRVYVLIVCDQNGKHLYVYDDGFIYYSKAPYVTGRTKEEIITSGYIDRDVYSNSPLTTKDFLKFLHNHYGAASVDQFVRSRNYVLQGFMEAAKDHFCKSNMESSSSLVNAQSFGVDIQPNKDLTDVKILEWNKGQSLEIMDTRDGQLKQKMVDDIYRTLGIIKDGIPSGFVEVWNSRD